MSETCDDLKKTALAQFLKIEEDDISEESGNQYSVGFGGGRSEYYVLADKEANDLAYEMISDEVEYFNASFINAETGGI